MLNVSPKFGYSGFTLVELMVAIAILAILISVGIPSFQDMILNSQIRNAAESVQNGLQRARAEAVSHNATVAFVLGAGTSWTVSCITSCGPTAPAGTVLDSRSSSEGSQKVARTVLPAPATTVTYDNLGALAPSPPAPAPLTQVDFGVDLDNDLALDANRHNLRVTIGAGSIRMCDPHLPSTNPRGC